MTRVKRDLLRRKSMIKELLRLCSDKNKASLYTNFSEPDKFHYGIVLAVNENEIAVQMISPDGDDDGVTVMSVDNVFRVEVGGQYAGKMEKLCSGRTLRAYELPPCDDGVLMSALSYALAEKEVVSIELIGSGYNDIVGIPETIADEECAIRQIDEYGCEDGFSFISVSDITKLSFATDAEKRIMRLWEMNK